MAKRSLGRVAGFGLIGAVLAIPIPFIGPIIGALVGIGLAYVLPPSKAEVSLRSTRNGFIESGAKLSIVAGLALLVFALLMETSVQGSFGRVNNIGLMNDKQSYLIVSGILIMIGFGLMLVERRSGNRLMVVDRSDDIWSAEQQTGALARKRYAASLGIQRVDDRYGWNDHRFATLEEAIIHAENVTHSL